MARPVLSQQEKDEKLKHKLDSIKNELESGKIKNFRQLFAILEVTPLAAALDIPYYTFDRKVNDPGRFTVSDMRKMAKLFNVDVQIIITFIFSVKPKK